MTIRMSYSPDVDALAIRLSPGVGHVVTREIEPGLYLDFDDRHSSSASRSWTRAPGLTPTFSKAAGMIELDPRELLVKPFPGSSDWQCERSGLTSALVLFLEFPRKTIVGVFDAVPIADGDGKFPTIPGPPGLHPGPHVTLTLEAHHNEAQEGQTLEIRLLDDKGGVVHSESGIPLKWHELGEGYPLFAPAGTSVSGWPLPAGGHYGFVFLVNESSVEGGISVYGQAKGEQVPVPPDVPDYGFKLEWGARGRQGTVSEVSHY